MKNRVTGLGDIFFKAKDSNRIKQWYKKHLVLPIDSAFFIKNTIYNALDCNFPINLIVPLSKDN